MAETTRTDEVGVAHNYDPMSAITAERVAKIQGRISPKRLLPGVRAAGYSQIIDSWRMGEFPSSQPQDSTIESDLARRNGARAEERDRYHYELETRTLGGPK